MTEAIEGVTDGFGAWDNYFTSIMNWKMDGWKTIGATWQVRTVSFRECIIGHAAYIRYDPHERVLQSWLTKSSHLKIPWVGDDPFLFLGQFGPFFRVELAVCFRECNMVVYFLRCI